MFGNYRFEQATSTGRKRQDGSCEDEEDVACLGTQQKPQSSEHSGNHSAGQTTSFGRASD